MKLPISFITNSNGEVFKIGDVVEIKSYKEILANVGNTGLYISEWMQARCGWYGVITRIDNRGCIQLSISGSSWWDTGWVRKTTKESLTHVLIDIEKELGLWQGTGSLTSVLL